VRVLKMKLNLEETASAETKLLAGEPSFIEHDLREVFFIVEAQARARGIRAQCYIDAMPPLHLDSSVACAMVYILLVNAAQATEAGGDIRFHASYSRAEEALVLVVEDTGVRMSEDVLACCKELFYTTKSDASGIGLALCERFVEEAGGTMDIESAPELGARVTIRVPVAAATLKLVGR
jgi:two-component system sensor histidine kinase HydH